MKNRNQPVSPESTRISAGLNDDSSAITSPQNPASPGSPSEAIATNANTPPRYGSFCISPPPISEISRVW